VYTTNFYALVKLTGYTETDVRFSGY